MRSGASFSHSCEGRETAEGKKEGDTVARAVAVDRKSTAHHNEEARWPATKSRST